MRGRSEYSPFNHCSVIKGAGFRDQDKQVLRLYQKYQQLFDNKISLSAGSVPVIALRWFWDTTASAYEQISSFHPDLAWADDLDFVLDAYNTTLKTKIS